MMNVRRGLMASSGLSGAGGGEPSSLMAIGYDVSPYVSVLSVPDFTDLNLSLGVTSVVLGLEFSPDGRYLAVGYFSSPYLKVFDSQNSFSLIAGTPTISGGVRDVSWSPDGSLLAVAHDSGIVSVYDTASWSEISNLTEGSGTGRSVGFSSDGTRLSIGAGSSPYLRVAETTSWSYESMSYTAPGTVNKARFSPDGNFLYVGLSVSPYLVVLNNTLSQIAGTPTQVNQRLGGVFSADSSLLYVAGFESVTLQDAYESYNTSDWSPGPFSMTAGATGGDIALSGDGAYLGYTRSTLTPNSSVVSIPGYSPVTIPSYPANGRAIAFN